MDGKLAFDFFIAFGMMAAAIGLSGACLAALYLLGVYKERYTPQEERLFFLILGAHIFVFFNLPAFYGVRSINSGIGGIAMIAILISQVLSFVLNKHKTKAEQGG